MSAENLDTERVITEVRGQPSLWDLSDIFYKDRDAKLQAWTEVCRALFPGYDDLPDKEKKEIGKQVQLRWRTARDAYMKCKNALKNVKSGSGGGKKSKYVYFDHMQFLDKIHIVDTVESINECQNTNETCGITPPSHSTHNQSQLPSTSQDAGNSSNSTAITLTPPTISAPNQPTVQKNAKKRKNREDSAFDKEMLNFFKENSEMMKNDDMAFFSSLLPITKSFNIRQKLLFRSEILRKAMEISNSTAGFPSMSDHNYFSTRPVSTSRPGSSTSTSTSYTITSPGSQEDITFYTVEETEAPNANVASQMQLSEEQYSSQALGNFPQEPIVSQIQRSEQQYSSQALGNFPQEPITSQMQLSEQQYSSQAVINMSDFIKFK